MEGEKHSGVVVLEQCDRLRRWDSQQVVALKTVVDQMAMAISNVRLRSLMKVVADESSGAACPQLVMVTTGGLLFGNRQRTTTEDANVGRRYCSLAKARKRSGSWGSRSYLTRSGMREAASGSGGPPPADLHVGIRL